MKSSHTKVTGAALLVTLGIVFGDIGTSPLYVISSILNKNVVTPTLVLGGLSCIFWTLTVQATFKYVWITLQADNHGEGGVLSLFSLIKRTAPKWTIYVAMLGCAALLADGMITPAISLTASVEGLKTLNDSVPVLPIVVVILIGLFTFQQFGTDKIGKSFGPIMLIWFSMLLILGFTSLMHDPTVFRAINPIYAYDLLTSHPGAWVIIGAVFLSVTGAEAMYADLGHVGKTNIRITWIFVKAALLINYFGQGAWVLSHMDGQVFSGINPFFEIMPRWFVGIGVVIASLASVVASQALISGSFSLINEAVKLETWFRVQILYPSKHRQQIFIPMINHILFLGSVTIVLYFQTSLATVHWNPQDDHNNNQKLVYGEWRLEERWLEGQVLVGAAAFSNSFYQPSQFVFGGLLWRPFDSAPAAYAKIAAGVLHGYKGDYQDNIPFNSSGFAPAIIGSAGYCYNRVCSELVLIGTAGLMWTLGVTLP